MKEKFVYFPVAYPGLGSDKANSRNWELHVGLLCGWELHVGLLCEREPHVGLLCEWQESRKATLLLSQGHFFQVTVMIIFTLKYFKNFESKPTYKIHVIIHI